MSGFFRTKMAAYVVPFVVFMGGLVLVSVVEAIGGGEDAEAMWLRHPEYWVYPLQTVACGVVLAIYWREYDWGRRGGMWWALAAGVVVLGIWVAPQAVLGVEPRVEGFDPTRMGEGTVLYWLTVVARFARLVVVVPLVEEIFWRGFLMRYLIREDFTAIPVGTLQWKSFGIVAVCFMLVHGMADWPAALLCGLIYNGLAVRTGSLWACVLAHGLTNLGLGAYIMATGQWGFW